MNNLRHILLFLFVAQSFVNAQTSINDYKYITIPKQFEFQSSEDQYQSNSLTKFLFNKYGYTAFFEDDNYPEDLSKNKCLALKAKVNKLRGFLITKIQIDLIDCKGNIVMSSKVGDTKVKEYAKSYNLAIRGAFETFQFYDYKYEPSAQMLATAKVSEETSETEEIEKLKKEVEDLKAEKNTAMESSEGGIKTTAAKVIVANELIKNPSKNLEPLEMLYAQPIDNGFQIVDTQPKKVMVLLNSGIPDMYIVKGKDAVVYKKEGSWVYAEHSGDDLKLKVINLKF